MKLPEGNGPTGSDTEAAGDGERGNQSAVVLQWLSHAPGLHTTFWNFISDFLFIFWRNWALVIFLCG